MAIFLKEQNFFEQGTTVSSKVRIYNKDGEVITADIKDNEHLIEYEVKHSNSGEIVDQGSMEPFEDEEGNTFYQADWDSDNDAELGDYYFRHEAEVSGDDVILTKLLRLREITPC